MPSRQFILKLAVSIVLILTLTLQYIYFQGTTSRGIVPKLKGRASSLFTIHRSSRSLHANISEFSQLVTDTHSLTDNISSISNSNDERTCVNMRRLVGHVETVQVAPSTDIIAQSHPDVQMGGHFIPNCSHTDKVAIIVPFRDRLKHLEIFLFNIHPILKRQLIEYTIFVVE